MGPKAKARLGLLAIIGGGYLLANGAVFAILAMPLQGANSTEELIGRVFGLTLILAIGITLLYYGLKYRRRAKIEMASQGS
jgi:hypothetical protein